MRNYPPRRPVRHLSWFFLFILNVVLIYINTRESFPSRRLFLVDGVLQSTDSWERDYIPRSPWPGRETNHPKRHPEGHCCQECHLQLSVVFLSRIVASSNAFLAGMIDRHIFHRREHDTFGFEVGSHRIQITAKGTTSEKELMLIVVSRMVGDAWSFGGLKPLGCPHERRVPQTKEVKTPHLLLRQQFEEIRRTEEALDGKWKVVNQYPGISTLESTEVFKDSKENVTNTSCRRFNARG